MGEAIATELRRNRFFLLRFRSLNCFLEVKNPDMVLGNSVHRGETEKAAGTEAETGRSFQETWRPQGDLNPRYRRERAVS